MGSTLSPVLANIYMDHIEIQLTNTVLFQKVVVSYNRYVDDVWSLIKGTEVEAENLLQLMNSVHPSIKFTIEKEVDNKLPFLDVLVQKSSNRLSWSIYEKKTKSNTIIPSTSHHTYHQKMAFFNFSFRRILTYLQNKDEQRVEKDKIINLGIMHGYDRNKLEKLYLKISQKMATSNDVKLIVEKQQKEKPLGNLIVTKSSFLDNNSKKILRSSGIRIVEKPGTKLKNVFNSHKRTSQRDYLASSGIYRIKCETCDLSYIGQTYRSIKERASEHLDSVNMGGKQYRKTWADIEEKADEDSSGFVRHIGKKVHDTSWASVELIQRTKKEKLDIMETFHIEQEDAKKLMNLKPGPLAKTATFSLYQKLKNKASI